MYFYTCNICHTTPTLGNWSWKLVMLWANVKGMRWYNNEKLTSHSLLDGPACQLLLATWSLSICDQVPQLTEVVVGEPDYNQCATVCVSLKWFHIYWHIAWLSPWPNPWHVAWQCLLAIKYKDRFGPCWWVGDPGESWSGPFNRSSKPSKVPTSMLFQKITFPFNVNSLAVFCYQEMSK